ncbi:MAG TPA: zinc-dependent alcohol dehydrogenase family protein [Smithella sp.]|nr:zinc-dependent alcohol dehydrogenase family protein [Smithella sp.]MDM7988770.1 zinc-dependent alcohol dehydrogenase family protein [Smithella sp.]HNY49283.1 zinc-dependent alcohol dehydrogenase family protein [Smithella sp.]HOG89970.1 zinc-dependent alcohol dehydrogenase family protein [Smithella sp.]HOU51122.1 zinc-dependent alcohol dehydrogenase family protein [Smithella sp.]
MKAAILEQITSLKENKEPLKIIEMPSPEISGNEILVKVSACGVCHTELDEIEGRTPPTRLPVILGHQVVGVVAKTGKSSQKFKRGDRVGVGWINASCGCCPLCLSGHDNLCPDFKATGRDVSGGYAQYLSVAEDFAFAIPEVFSDIQAAPLLCAGAIGYRSLRLTNLVDGQRLGLTGFGASAHLVLKMVHHRYPRTEIFVFARSEKEQKFALELGAVWAGDTGQASPKKLHAIIDTTPVWKPVVEALKNLEPAGRLVINAIRKEETDKNFLLKLDYSNHLWMEKEIKSVANVARRDIEEFLQLAAQIHIIPETEEYGLEEVNRALVDLKEGKIRGAKVLRID